MRGSWCVLAAAGGLLAGGCARDPGAAFVSDQRLQRGLVLILTGVQGNGAINEHIRRGLDGSGVQCALRIRPWGFFLPVAKLAVNQVNVPGNRYAARRVAEEIAAYQDCFPDRPVFLVGHSGGGGVAVFALEHLAQMTGSRKVRGAVLLSASISRDYDLTAALNQTEEGIASFFNPRDVALLGLGTTLLGNVDGGRAPSAGRTGFLPPAEADPPGKIEAYRKLFQLRITHEMMYHPLAPHVAATSVPFVSAYVAEWIIDQGWPPPGYVPAEIEKDVPPAAIGPGPAE